MKVTLFGLPGMKTQQALLNVVAAVTTIDGSIGVEWVSDANEMLEYGVVRTPTVMVDDRTNFEGRVPSIHELTTWIQAGQMMEADA